jgi:tetratricopeptide (TPR) repeat protein
VRQLDFPKAKDYCDNLAKDSKNCRASARFWLGIESYAEGNFELAESYFKQGIEIKNKSGKAVHWIAYKDTHSGWGNPEDMLKYIQSSVTIPKVPARYNQTLTYLIVSRTDTSTDSNTKKTIQKEMKPCLAAHGYLSLNVLKQHIRLFSQGKLSLQIKTIELSQTATKLDTKNYIIMDSLRPWDESLSIQMNKIVSESDLVFVAFPRSGGNANANYSSLPIVPKLAKSPFRTYIKMPSEWLTMINFPQIFHEYMHTVEFHMIRNGDKKFHATSHGADGKRVQVITGLPTETTGESDWAENLFMNQIQNLANEIEEKKAKNGWEQIFGIHIQNTNKFTENDIKELYKQFSKEQTNELYLPKTEDSN